MNYMYMSFVLGINCMLCLYLTSRIWNETNVCIFIVTLWMGWTPPTQSQPEIGKGLPCACLTRLVLSLVRLPPQPCMPPLCCACPLRSRTCPPQSHARLFHHLYAPFADPCVLPSGPVHALLSIHARPPLSCRESLP
jgi:hypothetical protein